METRLLCTGYNNLHKIQYGETYILKNINLDIINFLCDETKINYTDYRDIEQMEELVFFDYIKNIIDNNKYNNFDFEAEQISKRQQKINKLFSNAV